MRSRFTVHLVVLGILAAGCDTARTPAEHTDAAYAALAAGNLGEASASFELALHALSLHDSGDSDPLYLRARLGAIEVESRTRPEEAVAQFLILADARPNEIGERNFYGLASALQYNGQRNHALALCKAGRRRFPDSEALEGLTSVLSAPPADTAVDRTMAQIESLGYL